MLLARVRTPSPALRPCCNQGPGSQGPGPPALSCLGFHVPPETPPGLNLTIVRWCRGLLVPENLLPLLQPPVVCLRAAQSQAAQGASFLCLRAGEAGWAGVEGAGRLGPSAGHLSAAVLLGGRESPAVPPPAAEGHDPHRDAAADQVPPAPAKHRAEHRYGPPACWARSPIPHPGQGPAVSRLGAHQGWSPPRPQRSLRNGRRWSWRPSAAERFCTTSTRPCGTWRTCW